MFIFSDIFFWIGLLRMPLEGLMAERGGFEPPIELLNPITV
jgi:hypothetical protein